MKKNYLVIRLSSMGDVALTLPVLQAILIQNEDVHLTILTKSSFVSLFQFIPNLTVITPDLKGEHKGFLGLYRLFLSLKKQQKYDAVIDLHNVLRSQMLSVFFRNEGIPFFKINKGRVNKKKFTKKNHPEIQPLQHTTERYADVFRRVGLDVNLKSCSPISLKTTPKIEDFLQEKSKKIIGFAPFARHSQKKLPIEKVKNVIHFLEKHGVEVLIFGGGKSEQLLGQELENACSNACSVIGQFSLAEELELLQRMKLVITMDSSNMHLARLVGTKVISVWGATHPYLGFSPFQQPDNDLMIQIPVQELPCRPCSVYGNKPCHRGDLACMNRLNEALISQRVMEIVKS